MRKIKVLLSVDEEALMNQADYAHSFEDAVDGELGWIKDSGMYVEQWEETEL